MIPKTLQAWYYFRIIIVFVFIWIPGMILITCGAAYDGEKDIGRYMSGTCICIYHYNSSSYEKKEHPPYLSSLKKQHFISFNTEVGYRFASIQPVLSLIALMTKADVRKCIVDVVTLSFIFQRN